MPIAALALVLAAAGVHATWNFLTKASADPLVFSWAFAAAAALLYLPLVLLVAPLAPVPLEGWRFVAGTVLLHLGYFVALAAAYRAGDLSLVYPVARGSGIALVPLVGALALGERVTLGGALGIAAIVAGVVSVHLGDLARFGLRRALAAPGLRLALLTGAFIAAYSAWDKAAVALVAPPLYNYAIFAGLAVSLAPYVLLRRRAVLVGEWRERRRAVLLAAVCSPLSYLLVLFALTFSPVSYVAPAREVAVVIGALLGVAVLKEPHPGARLLGAALVAGGIALLTLTG
jgi:drug/metabolite transporter (DMT)-like permease